MNLRRCSYFVLSALVLSFALFSTSAYAIEPEINESFEYIAPDDEVIYDPNSVSIFSLRDDSIENGEVVLGNCVGRTDNWGKFTSALDFNVFTPPYSKVASFTMNNDHILQTRGELFDRFHIKMNDGSAIVDDGIGFNLKLNNVVNYVATFYMNYTFPDYNTSEDKIVLSADSVKYVSLQLYDENGTRREIVDSRSGAFEYKVRNVGDGYSIEFYLPAREFDVTQIYVYIIYDMYQGYGKSSSYFETSYYDDGLKEVWSQTTRYYGFGNTTLSIELDDPNTGLLNGIVEWVKNIYTSITQLPQKIGTVLTDGIKSLFVPSEQVMVGIKDKWDELLADRFGAVYQAGTILTDFASGITEQAEQDSIELPSVSYNFSGSEFTFGGYQVDIVPNGFEFLVEILKGVIDIVCTIAFLNALRTKYDQLMGG